MSVEVAEAVTALFVPGDRPDRYGKAMDSGADVVIIDLEDAVAPPDKGVARDAVATALRPGPDRRAGSKLRTLVRINDPESAPGVADLAMLVDLAGEPGHGLIGVVVPKAAEVDALAAVIEAVATVGGAGPTSEQLPVIALIESALGVADARALATLP